MKKLILMCLALVLSMILFVTVSTAWAAAAKYLPMEIVPVGGDTHTGGEITFHVHFSGTGPYDIYYSILEEGFALDEEISDVEYGHEESGHLTWDQNEWELRYTPYDPTMHVTLTLNVYDSDGACTYEEGVSASVYSVLKAADTRLAAAADPENSLFKITTRHFENEYRSRFTPEYEYTDVFPQNFGNDRDFWVWRSDNGYANKSVSFCHVGMSPRELCAFEISELGVIVHFCVPSMPEPLRLFAEKNGLNAIKVYFEKIPGLMGPYFTPTPGSTYVYFYKDQLELLPTADPDKAPAERYALAYRGWLPKISAGDTYQDMFLRISSTEAGSVASFGIKEYTSDPWHPLNHGGLVSWFGDIDSFLKDNPEYMLHSDGSYRKDNNGDLVFREDASIHYTERALEMSREEARWFVYHMEETLGLEHTQAYEPAPAAAVTLTEESGMYPWITAYENWIKNKRFLYDDKGRSRVNDYYWDPVTPDNLFDRNAQRPFLISLWDLDWDGVPELLVDVGGDFMYGGIHVYTWKETFGNVVYIGSIGYNEEADIYSCASSEYTGLVTANNSQGMAIEYDYYRVDGGRLVCEPVAYEDLVGWEDEEHGRNETYLNIETADTTLVDFALYFPRNPLLFFDMQEAMENGWFSGFVKPALEDQIHKLIRLYVLEGQTKGYAYYMTFIENWQVIQQALDLAQFNFSGMDVYSAKRELYFDTALKACGSTKNALYLRDGWVIDDLKTLKTWADFNEDYFFSELTKVVPESERAFLGTNGDDLKELIHKYLDKDISEQDLSLTLSQMGLYHPINHRGPLYQNMHNLKLLRIATKAMDAIGTVEKSVSLVKAAVKIVNQINLLESVDRDQLMFIADSYYARGDAEMKKVGKILMKFLNATDEEKVAMLIAEELKDFGLDKLYSMFENQLMKHAGGLASSVYTIVYMTIDRLTGVGELTDCNNQLMAAAENMHQFYLDVYNMVLNYEDYPNDAYFKRMVYAYLSYYSSVISANGKYQNLVSTGDRALLKEIINNDAMREGAEESKKDNEAYLKFMQQVRTLFDCWQYGEN